MLLEAAASCDGRATSALALNDVAVVKRESGRMLELRTWVDGVYVNTHGGDGFIVAHLDGLDRVRPVLRRPDRAPEPRARWCWCRSARTRCPTVRSWCGADSVVELELAERFETRAQVVCDGVLLCDLEPGVRLRIERGEPSARRCCIRPVTTTTASCARSCTGDAARVTASRPAVLIRSMLTHLQIRDFAIVESVEIEFRPGFTASDR